MSDSVKVTPKKSIKNCVRAIISWENACKSSKDSVCLHAVSDLGLAYGARPEYPVPRW